MASKVQINHIRDFRLCDRDHFKIVKGITIVAALVAYVCAHLWGISQLAPLRGVAAAMFLFCSGFGVSESYERKGGLFRYWENKVLKVWLPSLISLIIVSAIAERDVLGWISTYPLGLKGSFMNLTFAGYIVFWLLCFFVESRATRVVAIYLVALLAYFFVPDSVATTVMLCFPTGMMFSQYGLKRKIRAAKIPAQIALCVGCLIFTVAGWTLGVLTEIPYAEEAFWSVAYLFGALFILFFVFVFRKSGIFGIFAPFGFISFGLYLFYDSVWRLLGKARDWQSVLIILVVLLVVATAFSWIREIALSLNKEARRRKSTHIKGKMW